MLMRACRLRVTAASAAAAAPRRSLWATLSSRGLSSSTGDGAVLPHSEKRAQETAEERRIRQAREFPLLPLLLEAYKEATGHYVVPFHFPIPSTNDSIQSDDKKKENTPRFPRPVCGLVCHVSDIKWPEAAKGMNFGRSLQTFMKSSQHPSDYPEVARRLLEILNAKTRRQFEWREQTMPALRVYADIHGHSIVPVDFIVPRDDAKWPVAAWGLRLGCVVDRIRRAYIKQKVPAQELKDLKEIDFSFDVFETAWSDKVLPSLAIFAQVKGHCNVPTEFVVPNTALYPRKAWGYNLGQAVSNIRSTVIFAEQVARDASRLEAIKFVWDHSEHQWSCRILPSLEIFYRLNGHCRMLLSFVVPSEAPWPKEAWGLKLGQTVSAIPGSNQFPDQDCSMRRSGWLLERRLY